MKTPGRIARAIAAAAVCAAPVVAGIAAAPAASAHIDCTDLTRTQTQPALFQSVSPALWSHTNANLDGTRTTVYIQFKSLGYDKVTTTTYSGARCQYVHRYTNNYGSANYYRFGQTHFGVLIWDSWEVERSGGVHRVPNECVGYDPNPFAISYKTWNCPMK